MSSLPYEVYVLRLGHRPGRDKRITTHVGLVARAFGARGIYIAGVRDEQVTASLKKVVESWGGYFMVEDRVDPIELIKAWRGEGGEVIHLTMYGMPLDLAIADIRSNSRKKLVVVGSEKVPPIIYRLSDYNVSIGQQPHSEVAALAIFLDRLFEGGELYLRFKGARVRVMPSPRGKSLERV